MNNGGGDWYLPTFISEAATKGKDMKTSYDKWIDHVSTVSRMYRFIGKFEDCIRIFVPINEPKENGDLGHWYLLIIHVKQRYMELLDSASSDSTLLPRRRAAKAVVDLLDNILLNDIVNFMVPLSMMSEFPWTYDPKALLQPNGADYGVFTINNMEDPQGPWGEQYDSDKERAKLIIKLLMHPKNEVVDLHDKVERSLLRWKGRRDSTVKMAEEKKQQQKKQNLNHGGTEPGKGATLKEPINIQDTSLVKISSDDTSCLHTKKRGRKK
ncbi:uncharacterized protein LOC126788820 [Argentina anserina]|uniref:uncharacterized protein LOC126788820 n=1 Tax=Argentina anserina TaxID=57926 RepID=UPI0021763C5D|nr:uncharacterized protein LOC126788820 [Potentilla anserina]